MRKREDKKLETLLSQCFSYKKEPINPEINRTKDRGFYTIDQIVFPSYIETDHKDAVMYYYRPKIEEDTPAIVILPIIGEKYIYSKSFSRFLVKRGFSVLRVEKKKLLDAEQKNPLLYSKKVLKQIVIDTMRGIDWLEGQKYIDKEKIGIAGLSLGAILSSLVAANDPRIKAGVFMMGGGGLADILTETNESHIKEFREKILKKYNWTIEDYRKELSENIHEIEPLSYASKLDSSKYLMINGRYDKVIVADATEKLWEKMGKPEMIRIHSGHYTAVLFIPYLNYKMLEHFKKVFGEEYILTKTRRFKKWISNYQRNRRTSKKPQKNLHKKNSTMG